ncbi:TIGR01457 family HAD-type hydrolase [Brevibacillus sp. TJ4]|uniref:TIGR01457 family HAD-type hydrolase n=1 Tax=Brevibacillus sp. TJ4 TaxID=3234853 RepID=UPI003BA0450F
MDRNRYKGYLLDLDGTIYRGNEIIPGVVEFLSALKQQQIPYLYLTNNASVTPQQVAERLQKMGVDAKADEVYTSAMATAQYLREQAGEGSKVYMIGEHGLREALLEAGFTISEDEPQYVVVGIDRSFTYEKLAVAARAVRNGAVLIATNGDAAVPTNKGLYPGNGSLVAAVSVASGKAPVVVGKPEPIIVRYALQKLGVSGEETIIVGDNLHTDIEAGAKSGLDSLLVLTGFSTADEAASSPVKPTYIARDLLEWRDRVKLLG